MLFIYLLDTILILIANIILLKNGNIGIKEPETWAGIVIFYLISILYRYIFKKIIGIFSKINMKHIIILIIAFSIVFILLILYIIKTNSFIEIFTNGLIIALIYQNTLFILINLYKKLIKNV